MLLFSVVMKRELQTLREEIKTLASQIQRKLKSEFSLTSCVCLLGLNLFSLISQFSLGIEIKKGEEDGKYVPINIRMQRTQVRFNRRRSNEDTSTHRSRFVWMLKVQSSWPWMSPLLQHGVLSREFVELMGHCNTIQTDYRERNVERIKRQLKISECQRQDRGLKALSLSAKPFCCISRIEKLHHYRIRSCQSRINC